MEAEIYAQLELQLAEKSLNQLEDVTLGVLHKYISIVFST